MNRVSEIRTRADIEPILKEVVEVVVRDYQPEAIILYGSFAWGKPTRHSDIDLFIVKETGKSRFERNVEARKVIFRPGRGVSIHPMVTTPEELQSRLEMGDFFIKDVLSKGERLYGRVRRLAATLSK